MKRLLIFVLFLFSCSSHQPRAEKPVVAVYAAWKNEQFPVERIAWEKLSHIAISAVYPLSDGRIESTLVDRFIDDLVAQSKKHGKKVILSVGGARKASQAFKSIMAESITRDRFVRHLINYAQEHKVDGIDIDWEYWSYQSEQGKGGNDPVESQYLVTLLQDLREKLPASMLLTVDIAPGNWLGAQYKTEIQDYVDYVNLMAFDFTGRWDESKIGHHADYRTFVKAIKHSLRKGFKSEKLLVGLPTYGIEFKKGSNKDIQHVPYHDIVKILETDTKALQKGRVNNIYFETEKLIKRKTRYVIEKDLAGVFIFDIASDCHHCEHSLLDALSSEIIPSNVEVERVY